MLCIYSRIFYLFYRYPRPLVTVQFAAVECYQLSRVYYCFSQKKVHSDKGYPKWVFYVAFTGTAIWFLASLFFNYSWITTNCYIQVDGSSRESFQNEGIHFFPWPFSWTMLSWSFITLCHGVVEIATISLYWYKVLHYEGIRLRKIVQFMIVFKAFYTEFSFWSGGHSKPAYRLDEETA